MKICKNCGAELNDAAAVCRECGEFQKSNDSGSGFSDSSIFSMPYLSGGAAAPKKKKAPAVKTEVVTDNENDNDNDNDDSEDEIYETADTENIIDPLERAYARRDKRNRLIRLTALITAAVLIICTCGYLVFFRKSGYYRTLDKFIDGRTSSGGSNYLSIVPDVYLINAEKTFSISRPDLKSTTGNYLEYVKTQYEKDYGNGLEFTYKISSEKTVTDSSSLANVENTIKSTYSTTLDISEAAYVTMRLTTKGSKTQTTETKTLTFYKYDGDWYSLDAMEVISFACENAGYNMW